MLTLALALLAAGCGGADPAATDAAAGTPTPDASTSGTPVANGDVTATSPGAATTGASTGSLGGATGDADIPGLNELSSTEAAGGGAVKISKLTPKAFTAAACSKPIVIVLHQPDSILDQELLSSVNTAISHTSKAVQKDTVLLVYTPKDVKRYGDLLTKVGLLQAPGVAVVNRTGMVQNFYSGYVDPSLLLRVLDIAAAKKPCKVSNEDAGVAAADPSLGATATASNIANAATLASGGTVAPAAGTTTSTAPARADSEEGNAALKLLN